MKRDIIIIAESGGMTVGFGTGVLEALQEKNVYSRIDSVYGSSAGAHQLTYFITKQTNLAGTVPINDLNNNKFIKKNKFKKFISTIMHGKKYNLMHLDYLIDIEQHQKRLDVNSIKSSPIKLYFRVFDINKLKSKIINGKEHIFSGMLASSACIPYYNVPVRINNNYYIDGSQMITESFENIIEKNQDKKIIYIINHKNTIFNAIIKYPIRLLESILIFRLYGLKLAFRYATTMDATKIHRLRKYKNVILVVNNCNNDLSCTDKEKLIKLYTYGKEQGKQINI